MLLAAGVGDKITHFAGTYGLPFDAETRAVVEEAELVTEDSHGLSIEQIVGTGVDVVIGTDIGAGVDIESLAARLDEAGIKYLTVTGYCAGIEGRSAGGLSGFDMVYRDIATYGQVFGTEDTAKSAVQNFEDRVSAASEKAKTANAGKTGRTAAPLYVTNGGSLGAYGNQALVSEQFKILGLENIFADVDKRYFEPSTEQLTNGDPDLIFALYSPMGAKGVANDDEAIAALRGRTELAGVPSLRDDSAVQGFQQAYTGPGPLAVDGLERMAEWLVEQQ